ASPGATRRSTPEISKAALALMHADVTWANGWEGGWVNGHDAASSIDVASSAPEISIRRRGRPAVCDSGSVRESSEHLVMTRPVIVVQHHVLHLLGHHGGLRVSPSKLLNGSKRLPVRHD